MTSLQLASDLQLNRRHAANVCSDLSAAGYLRVIGRAGRHNVYAVPDETSAGDQTARWLFIVGGGSD